ncbi:AarF/UbiB family protein [Desulfococcaceae bacterium HSG8]|nr:AarF/UbiB family protein [Desulfococcaceae bacterium HSG8]
MIDNLDFENQKEFIKKLANTMSRDELIPFLLSFARKAGMKKFRSRASEEIMRLTKPAEVIPNIYSEYRQIVRDGILFLLSNFSPQRLAGLVADQILLGENVTTEERLITLAMQIPTLHKLGQIIARNRNMEPSFKTWMIRLENDFHRTDIADVRKKISAEIDDDIITFSIRIADEILAEASVGIVVPFTWKAPGTDIRRKGVFKVLKPGVLRHLREELEMLDELARFFDQNRQNYSLKNFRFIETFRDIKEALQKETNLSGEQVNLRKAFLVYGEDKTARIPRLITFSTENITIMEQMEGCKITDVPMSSADRKMCAKTLFKTVIGSPLFSSEEWTFFHGDPHAGNIYGFKDKKDGPTKLALLDWSQAGYLSKEQRIKMLRLAIGVISRDEKGICQAVGELSVDAPGENSPFFENTRKMIRDVLASRDYGACRFAKKLFWIIDQMAVKGIQFPRDLLLFRKSFFTLEGVLYDIDPEFDMDTSVIGLLETLFLEELPKRWMYLMFPHSDSPGNYKLPLSNSDLHMLASRLFFEGFKKGSETLSVFVERNMSFWNVMRET